MSSPLDHIPAIAARLAAAGLAELDLTGPDGHVQLSRRGGVTRVQTGAAPIAPTPASSGREVVASPGVGRFLPAHPLRDEPLVRVGDRVSAGQTIGLLSVGILLLPVPSPRDGVVAAMIAAAGTLVGYGDPLVALVSAAEGE